MSTPAIRIRYNDGGPPYTDVDFYDFEVLDVFVTEGRNSSLLRLGAGKAKEVRKTGFGSCRITFNLQSTNSGATSTLSKLKALESFSGQEFWVYPKFIDDPSLYFKYLMVRDQIPDEVIVAGKNAGSELLDVEFLEIEKVVPGSGYGDGVDEIYIDDIDEVLPLI